MTIRPAVTALLVLAALPAQEPLEQTRPGRVDASRIRTVAPSGPAAPADHVVEVHIAGGPGGGTTVVPFAAPVPARDLTVLQYPDGSLVVLVGGVSESLEIYRVDPASGVQEPLLRRTNNGRRLPQGFGDGLGSWPVQCGGGLLMFAFENPDEQVEFRAVVGLSPLASRSVPQCEDFEAHLDPESWRVEVRLLGPTGEVVERLSFLHPLAPRLKVEGADGGLLDFGAVPVGETRERELVLRNTGQEPLSGRIEISRGFELDGPPEIALPPGEHTRRRVRFAPTAVGDVAADLRVTAPVESARTALGLRGTGVAAAAVDSPPATALATPDPTAASPAPAPADDAGTAPATDPSPSSPPPPPPPARPEAIELETLWRNASHLVVKLRLTPADADLKRIALRIAGERVSEWWTYPPGVVMAVVQARALDLIEIAAVGPGGRSDWAPVGRAPAALRVEDGWVTVHAPASTDFLLLEVLAGPDEDAPTRRVLRVWRGRADPRGHAQFDAAEFAGDGAEVVRLQLMITSFAGGVWCSSVTEIGPSGPGWRGDRGK